MVPVNREGSATSTTSSSSSTTANTDATNASNTAAQQMEPPDTKKEEETEPAEPKGDPEMAPVYLRRLLPVFTQVYQSTMLPSVRYDFFFYGSIYHTHREEVLLIDLWLL